jgi:lysine biosynthesis protein LysW
MSSTLCPDCGGKIMLGPKPRKGQWIACPHCNADLEIVSLNPLELDWARYFGDERDARPAAADDPAGWGEDEAEWAGDDDWSEDDDVWAEDEEDDEWAEEEET